MKSLESLVSSVKNFMGASLLVGTITLSYLTSSCIRHEKQQSDNGPKIVFNSDVLGNGDEDIYIMDADGKHRKRLTDNPNFDAFPSISKYGKIAFTSGRDKNPGIYVMDLDGKNMRRVSSELNTDLMPSWSSDGTKLAFYSLRDGDAEIYVMDAEGNQQKRLTANSAEDVRPSWSSDGTKIFFDSDREGNAEIYVMDADGKNQKRLTENPASDIDPSCSVSGTVAFSSDRSGTHQIYVMDMAGGNIKQLTKGPGINAYPVWSPDGNRIFFASTRNGNAQIYGMNADGGNQKKITSSNFDDCDPSVSAIDSYEKVISQDTSNLGQNKSGSIRELSIDDAVGYFQDADINCIMGIPGAKLTAMYIMKTRNDNGKVLHNAKADLYLVDESANGLVITYKIGDVAPNSEIEALWEIESSSKIGRAWQSRQKEYFTARDRMWYGGHPNLLIFITSRDGTFEVNSKKFNLCYPVGGDKLQVTEIEVMSDYNYSIFENAGINLPKK